MGGELGFDEFYAASRVWIGGGAMVDDQRDDLTFLANLGNSLCVYGGQCSSATHPLTASVTANGSTTLHLGGSAQEFTVAVTNNADETVHNVMPVLSQGRLTRLKHRTPCLRPQLVDKGAAFIVFPLRSASRVRSASWVCSASRVHSAASRVLRPLAS